MAEFEDDNKFKWSWISTIAYVFLVPVWVLKVKSVKAEAAWDPANGNFLFWTTDIFSIWHGMIT